MFTGLIEEVGRLADTRPTGRGLRLSIAAERILEGLQVGDSVSIDGVCQTVVELTDHGFTVEAMAPTLARTTFAALQPDQLLNLERALPLGARVGGHLVQGHVDGVGRIRTVISQAEYVLIDIQLPEAVAEVTVLHGSIAVNGVSLTVNAMPDVNVAQVAIIPHTWQHTSFSSLQPAAAVNLEGDMIGKYVVEYMKRRGINAV